MMTHLLSTEISPAPPALVAAETLDAGWDVIRIEIEEFPGDAVPNFTVGITRSNV